VNVASLVTHRYGLDEAPAAYDMLVSGQGERPLGILIRYADATAASAPEAPRASSARAAGPVTGDVGIGFIGAGAFARSVLLPAFQSRAGTALRRVATAHGLTAFDAQRKFGFREAGTDADAVFGDPAVDLVCITTRHDAHADLVVRAIRAGKHVFVEKPLALDEDQLRSVEHAMTGSKSVLLVGFNRRFSPLAVAMRRALEGRGPLLATYRVNAGSLPPGHWLNDPAVGGGRIIGEGCHFVDFLSFLTGDATIETVEARCAGRPQGPAQDVVIQLGFTDGSVGQILYTAKGDPALGKERVEAHAGGASVVLDDFRSVEIVSGGKRRKSTAGGKGHAEEIAALLSAVKAGGPSPISPASLFATTRATLRVHEAIASGAGSVAAGTTDS